MFIMRKWANSSLENPSVQRVLGIVLSRSRRSARAALSAACMDAMRTWPSASAFPRLFISFPPDSSICALRNELLRLVNR